MEYSDNTDGKIKKLQYNTSQNIIDKPSPLLISFHKNVTANKINTSPITKYKMNLSFSRISKKVVDLFFISSRNNEITHIPTRNTVIQKKVKSNFIKGIFLKCE